eukprot:m.177403 g.177403  ORF g.177403 m.177403 type:complete len:87 (+) comp31889_c0_seq1:142-402(+)
MGIYTCACVGMVRVSARVCVKFFWAVDDVGVSVLFLIVLSCFQERMRVRVRGRRREEEDEEGGDGVHLRVALREGEKKQPKKWREE